MDEALITVNSEVNHGRPSIRNTRHSVESILEYLAGGDSAEDILREFPELTREDIHCCIAYSLKRLRSI